MLERGHCHVLTRLAGPLLGAVLLACAGADPAGDGSGTPGDGAAEDSLRATTVVDSVAGLRVALTTDRASYPAGAPIRMTLAVTNATDDPVSLRFPSAQRFDFVIREAGDQGDQTVRWRWSEGMMFAQVTGEEVVPPGDSNRYEATFGERLDPGLYTIAGVVAAANRPTSARVTVRVHE